MGARALPLLVFSFHGLLAVPHSFLLPFHLHRFLSCFFPLSLFALPPWPFPPSFLPSMPLLSSLLPRSIRMPVRPLLFSILLARFFSQLHSLSTIPRSPLLSYASFGFGNAQSILSQMRKHLTFDDLKKMFIWIPIVFVLD